LVAKVLVIVAALLAQHGAGPGGRPSAGFTVERDDAQRTLKEG
jgi:hypothetical protein